MVKQGGWPRPQVRNDAEALATEVASVLGIGVFPDQLLELRLRGSLELFLQHLSVGLVVSVGGSPGCTAWPRSWKPGIQVYLWSTDDLLRIL